MNAVENAANDRTSKTFTAEDEDDAELEDCDGLGGFSC
jgi:hypothetical protein